MIDFYVANNFEEVKNSEEFTSMDDVIQDALNYLIDVGDIPEGIKMIAKLDPYEVTFLDKEQVTNIFNDFDLFIYSIDMFDFDSDDVLVFINDLKLIFERAITLDKGVFAVGD